MRVVMKRLGKWNTRVKEPEKEDCSRSLSKAGW